MKWKDIKEQYKFSDNSIVTERHQTHDYPCYKVYYNNRDITLSGDHLLAFNISPLNNNIKEEIKENCKADIPIKEKIDIEVVTYFNTNDVDHTQDIKDWVLGKEVKGVQVEDAGQTTIEFYIFTFDDNTYAEVKVNRIPLEYDNQKIDEDNYWITVQGLYYLYGKYGILTFGGITIQGITSLGKLPCFCVSTNTGHYQMNGLKHHNSVTIQNIILHGIEHRNKIALGLIDPKYTEFSAYKNMKGIVGVANTVEETVELLRIAKMAMYRRNQLLSTLKLKSVYEYTPTKKSGKVYVTGRDYLDDDIIKVLVNEEQKDIPAKELVELVNKETNSMIAVCLNGEDWILCNLRRA